MAEHYTEEGTGLVPAGANEIEEARKRHHLASADPERDGTLTGPAHEEKYGLERAEESKARWTAVGVNPIENGPLQPGDEGYENSPQGQADAAEDKVETATAKPATEDTSAARASKS